MTDKIVVVDDEKVLLHLASMVLRNKGYQVFTAENGQEGLKLIEAEAPAVVLLDYMMPVMNGMDTLKQIVQRFPETYVVMFTGKGSEEIAVELMKAGAYDYITKPFNNTDLVERIQHVLRIRKIEIHNRELLIERDRLLREIEAWNRELEDRVEQKTFELKQAQEEIVEAEKLAALGHMTAGLAHEIRNPLNNINLFANLIKAAVEDDSELESSTDRIFTEVSRIDNLLRNMLTATEGQNSRPSDVELNEQIHRSLVAFADQAASQGVEMEIDLAEPLPKVHADAREMELVLSNLIGNALYEMRGGGSLYLQSCTDEGRVQIIIRDTGRGIPPENLTSIFETFFTTKEKGTGIGLSVVKRTLEAYNGTVEVSSTLGAGTTFKLSLPALST